MTGQSNVITWINPSERARNTLGAGESQQQQLSCFIQGERFKTLRHHPGECRTETLHLEKTCPPANEGMKQKQRQKARGEAESEAKHLKDSGSTPTDSHPGSAEEVRQSRRLH